MLKRKYSSEEETPTQMSKRKYSSCSEEETSDDLWQPETSDEEPCDGGREAIQTRSRGTVVKPVDNAPIDAAMDKVDTVVDNESDLSSDTDEDCSDDERSGSEEGGEEEEESDEDDDYSDDDSFVTSNEDADRGERDEVLESYCNVFDADEEHYPEAVEDVSIGGPAITGYGSGDM
jgi:hypothetical protein